MSLLLDSLLKPSFVCNSPDCIQINENFNRVIMAVGYPRQIEEGWLDRIISSEGNFDLSMFIEPASIEFVLGQLNRELIKQKSDMMAAELKGIVNPSLRVQYEDTYNTLQRLQTGEEKLFNFSLYANAKSSNKNELNLLTKKIESEFNSIMIIPKTPYFKMQQAIQSVVPVCKDRLRAQRNIPSNALSACFPFTSRFLNLDEDGVMFGVNQANNIPIILNQYKFTNYNGVVLGSSGGGKSFFVKLYIIRNLLKGMQTYIVDPQGEYSELTEKYDGQIVTISRKSKTIINPLDLMGRDFGDKMLSLMDLFKIMFGDLTEVQKNILDKAIIKTYEEKSILPTLPETWQAKPPILSDLYKVLERQSKHCSKIERMTYDALLNRLRIYAKGSFSFLSRHTYLNLGKKLISFNIKEMPAQVKPVMMFLILDFIYERIQKDRERKLIVVDEAWQLLRYGEHAEYLFKICKTARKFGAGLVIITQEVNDLLNSQAGNTVLANTAWKLLLRQEPAVINELVGKFNLNKEEKSFLLTVDAGEGLLSAMNDRIPIRVVASKKEYDIITTNPDELKKREMLRQCTSKEDDFKEEIYKLEKSYYKMSELNEKQIDFLKAIGYIESRQSGLEPSGAHKCLVGLQPGNEGTDHAFLVQLIYEEIKKHTSQVTRHAVQKPDLIFTAKGKQCAIEVETGKNLWEKEKMKQKAQKLKEFKKGWFVVTDWKLKNKYKQYGKTLGRFEVKKELKKIFQTALHK